MSTGERLQDPEPGKGHETRAPEPDTNRETRAPEPDTDRETRAPERDTERARPHAEPETGRPRRSRADITSERVFGLVYGAIAVGVLLAAEDAADTTFAETVGSVAIALVLYWLAHSYALLTSRRLRKGEKLTLRGLAEAMLAELWIVAGAAEPLIALIVFSLLGAKLASAETAAIWAAAIMVLAIEVVAGIRAKLSGRELLLQAVLGATLGLLVILLSAILH
ncbi:MAG: hypothetical protein JOZ98_19530 [Solirubrobacterales bacterium]|nr:hypothetical protein [Solirubrobacterales bacterium]MBV9425110.1 hypothetical protein [Solirubrobacterales bacterium]MBV9796673.1 hypothetical protein [Solirubrobacterales bacterium]